MVRKKRTGGDDAPAPSAVAAAAEQALRAALRHMGDVACGGSARPQLAPSAKASAACWPGRETGATWVGMLGMRLRDQLRGERRMLEVRHPEGRCRRAGLWRWRGPPRCPPPRRRHPRLRPAHLRGGCGRCGRQCGCGRRQGGGRGRQGALAVGASLPFRPRLASRGGEGGTRRCQQALSVGRPLGSRVKSAQDRVDGLAAQQARDKAEQASIHAAAAEVASAIASSEEALGKAEAELRQLHAEALQEQETPAAAVVGAMAATGRFDELLQAIRQHHRQPVGAGLGGQAVGVWSSAPAPAPAAAGATLFVFLGWALLRRALVTGATTAARVSRMLAGRRRLVGLLAAARAALRAAAVRPVDGDWLGACVPCCRACAGSPRTSASARPPLVGSPRPIGTAGNRRLCMCSSSTAGMRFRRRTVRVHKSSGPLVNTPFAYSALLSPVDINSAQSMLSPERLKVTRLCAFAVEDQSGRTYMLDGRGSVRTTWMVTHKSGKGIICVDRRRQTCPQILFTWPQHEHGAVPSPHRVR